jgi:hypothetical protein
MQEHCNADMLQCDTTGLEARDDGATYALVANIAGGVGIVALGAGLYLVLSDDTSESVSMSVDLGRSADGSVSARVEWVGFGDALAGGGQGVVMKGEFW